MKKLLGLTLMLLLLVFACEKKVQAQMLNFPDFGASGDVYLLANNGWAVGPGVKIFSIYDQTFEVRGAWVIPLKGGTSNLLTVGVGVDVFKAFGKLCELAKVNCEVKIPNFVPTIGVSGAMDFRDRLTSPRWDWGPYLSLVKIEF